MKTTAICFLIAFAIVATLFLMPASSWVLKNQLDHLTETRTTDVMRTDVYDAFVAHWATDPNTYKGENASEKFAHALYSPRTNRMPELVRYAEEHQGDKFAWGMIVRMTGMLGPRDLDFHKNQDPAWDAKKTEGLKIGKQACFRGEQIDPKNAYFPLMHASFAMQQNQLQEMSMALGTAANCTNYTSFVNEEAETLERALLSAKGYRGVVMRKAVDASIMLPDFSHMKALARYVNRHGSLQDRRNLIQTAQRMIGAASIAIEGIEAAAIVKFSVRAPIPATSKQSLKLTDTEWLRLAGKFDDSLKTAGITPPQPGTLEIFQTVNRFTAASAKYFEKLPPPFEEDLPDRKAQLWMMVLLTAPMVLMTALVICLPLAMVGYGLTRIQSDSVRRMLPHFLALPSWGIMVVLSQAWACCGESVPVSGLLAGVVQVQLALLRLENKPARITSGLCAAGFLVAFLTTRMVLNQLSYIAVGLMVVLAVTPWFSTTATRSRIVTIGGAVLATASIFLPDASAALGAVIYGIALLTFAKNKSGLVPKWIEWMTVGFFLIICLITGAFVAWKALVVDSSLLAAVLIAPFATIIFVGKRNLLARRTASTALLAFSLLLTIFVGLQIRWDRKLTSTTNDFPSEVIAIRKLAGLKP